MRKVREVLRLKHAVGASEREIAVSVGISRSTVAEYLRHASIIGITCRRYKPGINRTYQELAEHTMILPTRPRKPRDKAKVGRGRYRNQGTVKAIEWAIQNSDWGRALAHLGCERDQLGVLCLSS